MTGQDRKGPEDDVRSLWQEQPGEAPPDLSIEVIQRRAAAFDRTLRLRNARESAAGALVAIGCLAGALLPGAAPLQRAAAIAGLAGISFVLWHLARHGSGAATLPADARATAQHLAALRARLEEQRALLASAWRWYVAPLVPAPLLLFAHLVSSAPPAVRATPEFWLRQGSALAFVLAVFAAVAWLNVKEARRLAAEIRDLGAPDLPLNTR